MTASPTILIADPDEETRLALAEAVVRIDPGARVIEAADGSALNRALAGSRIDLLFVDVLLPQTNGADIRRWRETGNPQGLVVLVTDMLAPRWSSTARRVGAYDVILKPLGDLHIARLLAAGRILRAPSTVSWSIPARRRARWCASSSAKAISRSGSWRRRADGTPFGSRSASQSISPSSR